MIIVCIKSSENIYRTDSFDPLTLNNIMLNERSVPILELNVFVDDSFKDMDAAFTDHDIITDVYRRKIFYPENSEERELGYRP